MQSRPRGTRPVWGSQMVLLVLVLPSTAPRSAAGLVVAAPTSVLCCAAVASASPYHCLGMSGLVNLLGFSGIF